MIYHWCPRADWESARDTYRAPSLDDDGFIHCSFHHQVEPTASVLYRGIEGLVLLSVDETGLPVVVEDCYEAGEGFPHVYGAIPVSAVVEVLDFPPEDDGRFRLPARTPYPSDG